MEPPLVIALGGSLLRPEHSEREVWLSDVCGLLRRFEAEGKRVGIVVGGGLPAREAIGIARPLIGDEYSLDRIGIAATRLNASILREVLCAEGIDVSDKIPTTTRQAAEALDSNRYVVMGGTFPGHTTDAVALSLAIELRSDTCTIATNVSHVFSANPKVDPSAVPVLECTLKELKNICEGSGEVGAGSSGVVDLVAIELAISHKINLNVVGGSDLVALENALKGVHFTGTRVIV